MSISGNVRISWTVKDAEGNESKQFDKVECVFPENLAEAPSHVPSLPHYSATVKQMVGYDGDETKGWTEKHVDAMEFWNACAIRGYTLLVQQKGRPKVTGDVPSQAEIDEVLATNPDDKALHAMATMFSADFLNKKQTTAFYALVRAKQAK